MFQFIPHLWVLFMLGITTWTIVVALKNRPKKEPKAKTAAPAAVDSFSEQEPILDFGDELAQAEAKQ